MNLTGIKDNFIGAWSGKNLLRLTWLDPSDHFSDSDLLVAPVANGKFLSFAYTWEYEHESQEGLIVVGYDAQHQIATGAFMDSWHMSSKIMPCLGTINPQGAIELRGSYEVPSSADWGWKLTISVNQENLQLTMFNCSPDGAEELAVQADYQRTLR